MQLGVTWPLQRLLRTSVPYGETVDRGFCWDAHCITLRGRSCLLLVHCESRYTCVSFDLSAFDWANLSVIAAEEIRAGLEDAGISAGQIESYLVAAGEFRMTRTHGRREVAFLNRAWEDVLSADLLVDQSSRRQPMLNHAVNSRFCRCAGEDEVASAQEHLERYFARRNEADSVPNRAPLERVCPENILRK